MTGAAAAVGLAACGFEPLYARRVAADVDEDLARIKVEVIPQRVGQQVHNYLLDRLNRRGRPLSPLYSLDVDLAMARVVLDVEKDETVTRAKLVLTANIELVEIETGETLLRRAARSANSYNIVNSALATRSAELDAIDRAAREVSDEIRTVLALYFRRRGAEMAAQ